MHTLTFDNGKEFAGHRAIGISLATAIFFARPYHSCERGLNEHTNGLLRQFVPKSANLRTLGLRILQDATDRLNHCPRKVLGYRPPIRSSAPPASQPAWPHRRQAPLPATSEPLARGALWSRHLSPPLRLPPGPSPLPVPADRPS